MKNEKQLYKILYEVQYCKTMTEIANKLFISEPYISKVINQAELYYHTNLINRSTKPITLTKAGNILLNDLRILLETKANILYDLAPYQDNKKYQVNIAMNPPWLEMSATEFIKYLNKSHPHISFSFFEKTTNIAQNTLLNHNIDIFIGKYLTHSKIISSYAAQSELYLAIPKTSPKLTTTTKELTPDLLKRFNDQNYISLTDDSFFQVTIDNMFKNYEINLNKIIKVETLLASIGLVANNLGFAIVVESIANYARKKYKNEINLIHIPHEMLELSIGVSYLTDSHPTIKNIANDITQYIKQNPFF